MRTTSSAVVRPACAALAALALASWAPAAPHARADDEPSPVHHVAPPPAPEAHPATLSVEVHGAAEAPIERDAICPEGAACVLGLGVGIGARIERRSADRIGLFAGYDFWLVDSNGVFELGALHAIRAGVRYVFDDSWLVHPFVDAAIGLVAFGDTANIATVGGTITAGGGAEIELSESVAFVAAAEAWFLSTAPFSTRDSISRAEDLGVNVAVQITIGISVLVGPSAAMR